MARHSRFVGEEARDAKSKEARRSLIHTGNWEEKEKEEECANYKAEHDPQPQGSDDRTGHCQVEFPAAASDSMQQRRLGAPPLREQQRLAAAWTFPAQLHWRGEIPHATGDTRSSRFLPQSMLDPIFEGYDRLFRPSSLITKLKCAHVW
jgi:hypothetical protein